ncbi:unnamed protein product [Malus baccata var. baccata]
MDTSTSSSSSLKRWKYDVYLSFKREDTRKNFTDYLYFALKDAQVNVFMDDDELRRGESLKNDLIQGIEGSKIAVIVFSRWYAESSWCLDELVKIMECRRTLGQIVFPIFYDVDPSDVRKQTGTFATAFLNHDRRLYEVKEKLQLWRDALTEAANLSCFVFGDADGYEGKFIREIVTQISRALNRSTCLEVATNLVGIGSRVQAISNYLDVGGSNDVRIIGIWGMGGVGKTTVAKAIFNKYQYTFEGKSFLQNVRERKLVQLQEQLLFDILKPSNIMVSSVDQGILEIVLRLQHRRVLAIVDDIDCMEQLEALAIKRDSFGAGSRIIITTRDEHLLRMLGVDTIYELPAMNREEALLLLSWHAFRKNYPEEEYFELTRETADYCGGLPLALEVVGSYLSGKSVSAWKGALEKLESHTHEMIHERLKISFDELADDDLKAIFLDISCFFTGMNKDYVMKILDGCDLYPEIGISVLQEQCLVTTNDDFTLVMHDLLRYMGREIVHAESPDDPGKRSRLWHHEDVICVLRNKSGTEAVQGITLDLQESDKASFSAEAFRNMQSLRLLKLNYVELTGSYNNVSNELRWLCWHGFPLEVIPEDFDHPNIVAIDLSYSKLIRVWEDSDLLLEKLKYLNLSHSHYLTLSPDFSKLPNLEQLILQDCKCLLDIDQSIGQLEKLVLLDLKDCKVLRDLPESFYELTSLETLDLAGCSKFENLAEDLGEMVSLKTLIVDNTAMKSIPPSISRLKNLMYLSLHGLKWPLTSLLPPMPVGLNSIRVLSLAGCDLTDVAILMELRSLISLDLQRSSICSLPSLSGFSKLDTLRLNYCTRLHAIPDLPTSLEILEADECIALEKMPDFSEMSRMRVLHLNHSPKLTEIPGLHKSLKSMTRIHMEACKNLTADFRRKILQGWTSCGYGGIFLNGNYMPEWFRYFGGDEVCLVVPQSVSSNFKGLTLCCVYSSNKQSEDCPLGISIRNKTKHTAMLARITYASVPTSCDSEDHYLWQGQLSNDVLGWQDGDEVKIFVGPVGPGDNSARVKKIAVDLVWDKFMKENMDDSHPGLYDFNPHEARASHDAFDGSLPSKILRSDNIVGDDDEAGPSNDSSDENQAPKRLRPDPGNQIT